MLTSAFRLLTAVVYTSLYLMVSNNAGRLSWRSFNHAAVTVQQAHTSLSHATNCVESLSSAWNKLMIPENKTTLAAPIANHHLGTREL